MTHSSFAASSLSSSLNIAAKRPLWWPLAQFAIARLRAIHSDLADIDGSTRQDDADVKKLRSVLDAVEDEDLSQSQPRTASEAGSALDFLSDAPSARHLPPEIWDAIEARGGDPFATTEDGYDRPELELSLNDLLLALRLAASFKTNKALAEHLARGAIVVLVGINANDMARLRHILRDALLPDGWTVIGRAPDPSRSNCLQMLERGAPEHDLRNALASCAPLLLALEVRDEIPPAIASAKSDEIAVIDLAPVDADLLIALLRASHSATGRIDEAATRTALPDDRALAKLSVHQLFLALRAPTAPAVAERLAGLTRQMEAVEQSKRETPCPISGSSPVHDAARRIVADLKAWQDGAIEWGELNRSVLFHGAPGTGKSFLARAMGANAGVSFIQSSFAYWQSLGHLGNMLKAMRDTFDEALSSSPCILFIDEIDAVGSRFDRDSHGRSYRTQVINGFLEQVDRLTHAPGVILIGACNHPNTLDPAILRPGRFDLKLEMPLPGRMEIEAMLAEALGSALSSEDIGSVARDAIGTTPATLDAAIRAAKSDARFLGIRLDAPLVRKHLGVERFDPNLLHRMAIHEAGHAMVAHHLHPGSVLRLRVGPEGGETLRDDRHVALTRAEIMDELTITLSGRAAEALTFPAVSAGSGGSDVSDLARATQLALKLHARFGLGPDGPIWHDAPDHLLLTDDTLRARVRVLLDQAERRARTILKDHKSALLVLAGRLTQEREIELPDLLSPLEGSECRPRTPPEYSGDCITLGE